MAITIKDWWVRVIKIDFIKHSKVEINEHILMSEYTYTLTGGRARYLAKPNDTEELIYLVKRAIEYEIPYLLLGNASNVIVSDDGLDELVIITTNLTKVEVQENRLIASAGATLKEISEIAAEASLTGIEFACGIPGTLGGAIFMNAGAYDGEISDIVTSINTINHLGEIKTYTHQEFLFSYRHSLAQDENLVIVSAVITLSSGNKDKIYKRMTELNDRRRARQPLNLPSCGSVFRRPPGHFVAPMIQEVGLQGKKIGGAQVSTKHAGFIVNVDHATATDYLELIHLIQEKVYEKFGVHLQPEVRFLGFKK